MTSNGASKSTKAISGLRKYPALGSARISSENAWRFNRPKMALLGISLVVVVFGGGARQLVKHFVTNRLRVGALSSTAAREGTFAALFALAGGVSGECGIAWDDACTVRFVARQDTLTFCKEALCAGAVDVNSGGLGSIPKITWSLGRIQVASKTASDEVDIDVA
mmetsp:Transcript_9547/g.19174  ORF Transcript_9547/g.19174 Transcript_9547/m.19174 type:complete len:165 (-) Transcript_9547:1195-1689(-)